MGDYEVFVNLIHDNWSVTERFDLIDIAEMLELAYKGGFIPKGHYVEDLIRLEDDDG